MSCPGWHVCIASKWHVMSGMSCLHCIQMACHVCIVSKWHVMSVLYFSASKVLASGNLDVLHFKMATRLLLVVVGITLLPGGYAQIQQCQTGTSHCYYSGMQQCQTGGLITAVDNSHVLAINNLYTWPFKWIHLHGCTAFKYENNLLNLRVCVGDQFWICKLHIMRGQYACPVSAGPRHWINREFSDNPEKNHISCLPYSCLNLLQ